MGYLRVAQIGKGGLRKEKERKKGGEERNR
jgi:hypothetical protein